jgi:hypothetical protein
MTIKQYPLVTLSTEPDSDIVFAEFRPDLKVDLDEAREIVTNRLEFTRNRKHFLILDVSNVRQLTAEAKEFMQRPDAGLKNILGAAFTGGNPVAVLIANIFIKSPKDFQARFFTSREAAVSWIEHCKLKISTE